jgi:hypothetical protein
MFRPTQAERFRPTISSLSFKQKPQSGEPDSPGGWLFSHA